MPQRLSLVCHWVIVLAVRIILLAADPESPFRNQHKNDAGLCGYRNATFLISSGDGTVVSLQVEELVQFRVRITPQRNEAELWLELQPVVLV